ncbi:hypothetical protein PQR67_12220 [Paraburkholderia fungorum]|uniref:hypothetical protein n=1 Tax=Paraburkholderia fungorum TaxID=134537 RepID=UPI0038B6CC3F
MDDLQVIHGIFFAALNPADADAHIRSRNVLAPRFFRHTKAAGTRLNDQMKQAARRELFSVRLH